MTSWARVAEEMLVDALGTYKQVLLDEGCTEEEAAQRIVNKVKVLLNAQETN